MEGDLKNGNTNQLRIMTASTYNVPADNPPGMQSVSADMTAWDGIGIA